MPLHSRPPEELRSAPPITGVETGQVDTTAGLELEQARTADAAWRAERAARWQGWIDRARDCEQRGYDWVSGPLPRRAVLLRVGLALGCVLQPVSGDLSIFSFVISLIVSLMLARNLLGLALFGLGRLGRFFLVESARRASVEVVNPRGISFFEAEELPSTTASAVAE